MNVFAHLVSWADFSPTVLFIEEMKVAHKSCNNDLMTLSPLWHFQLCVSYQKSWVFLIKTRV